VARRAFFATLVFAALCCGGKSSAEIIGDFGRPEDSVFVDEFLPWLKDGFDDFTGRHIATIPYTDDERSLRNLAWTILQPLEVKDPSYFTVAGVDFAEWWHRWCGEPHPFDVRSYAEYLVNEPYRSSAARYARLIDDIRADAGRVTPFFSMANRVLEADAVRARSFQYVARFPADKFDLAHARVIENHGLMDAVYERFRQRIASYRYALEYLLVIVPSPNAVEAERALFSLEERLKRMTSPLPLAAASGPVTK